MYSLFNDQAVKTACLVRDGENVNVEGSDGQTICSFKALGPIDKKESTIL